MGYTMIGINEQTLCTGIKSLNTQRLFKAERSDEINLIFITTVTHDS